MAHPVVGALHALLFFLLFDASALDLAAKAIAHLLAPRPIVLVVLSSTMALCGLWIALLACERA
jgi:hypothetical protein